MALPRIPTFDELLKKVKQPKVPEVEELDTQVAPEFRNLPPGWSVRRTPFGDSLISPRGLTFRNLKLEGGKITDFQAFRGDKPVRLPPVEPPPEQPPVRGLAPLPLRPFAPLVEPPPEQAESKELADIQAKISDPTFTGDRIELALRLIDLETKRAGRVSQGIAEPLVGIQKQLRSEEGISSQEFESLAGMTLQEYSVALLEGRVERISQPGERLGSFTTPEGERRIRIERVGEDLSLSEKIFRFQTGDLPVEALPEPVRALGKAGTAAKAAAEATAFTVAGVPISYGDVTALALIALGIYQGGTTGLNILLNRVLSKPGDLNKLGIQLTRAGLNRNLNILERQSGVKIPPATRKAFIDKYLSDMAASWARNVAGQGKAVTPQSLQLASQNTYAATANAVNKEISALIPKGTQTGALATGGIGRPAQVIKVLPSGSDTSLLIASQTIGKKIGLDVEAIGGIAPGEYWVSISARAGDKTALKDWLLTLPEVTQKAIGRMIGGVDPVTGRVGATKGMFAPFKNIQDANKFLETGDTSLIAKTITQRGTPWTPEQLAQAREALAGLPEAGVITPEPVSREMPPLKPFRPGRAGLTDAQAEARLTALQAKLTPEERELFQITVRPEGEVTPITEAPITLEVPAVGEVEGVRQIINNTIQTQSGRSIPVPPSIRLETTRKATIDVAKVDAWLVEQGRAEALARNDEFVGLQFEGMNPKRLSPADKDILNDYLFGETDPIFTREDVVPPTPAKPPTVTKPPVTPQPSPEAPQAITKPVTKEVVPAEPTKAEIAKQAEQLKAKLEAEPIVKPPAPKTPVERRTEIKELLATPAKDLPKGTSKIALRKELARINKELIPQEKALRQKIMASVKSKSLGITQSRNIFREVGGSRYLTNLELTQLEKVLKAIQRARPIRIKGKKVITLKNEALIQSAKRDLIDQGILTEAAYKDILKSLKLSTDKYVDSQNFITNAEGGDIIRNMRNIAILNPLGELKFGKPTALKLLTSQTYYAQILGVKPLVNPLELAKVDFDLAFRAMSNAIDTKLREVDQAWGVSISERITSKAKNIPTKGSSALRDLLDKNEEAPASLTPKQEELFNWFRNLNRTIINGENEVRRAMGVEEIAYRQAYVRHIPDAMASEIMQGTQPIPPSLQFWARKLVGKKIFNPMELHRQLSDDLADLYTKDLAFASKNMVHTGLKEIHLAQPLRAFTEQMVAISDIMPASTQRWVTDYVNQVIKGQQTEWDESINNIVTESGIGGVIDAVLKPFNRTLGQRPITRLSQNIGKATIYSVMALPRPRLARLMIRNVFQRTQELALHGVGPTLRSFLSDPKGLKELKKESRYLKSYTGVEEWPTDLLGKLGKTPLAPYQFTATLNADRGMSAAYYDFSKFVVDRKYKDMVGRTGKRWPSEKRTYTEEEGFLYPEEQKILLEEMELATRATQYQYIGMGMPEIFRHKTLAPFTRLQSWWMNHFTMFHREAFHRFVYGETTSGYPLPWSSRVNWLKYLLLGGAILTSMGYTASFLLKVLPHNESPFAQFAIGLVKYVSAGSDWERTQAKRDMQFSWRAMVPGAMAADEIQKLWTGEMEIWQAFFYGREEDGPPLHIPDYGFPIEESGVDKAETEITESISKFGKKDDVGRDEAIERATEAGASKAKLVEIRARDWTFDITSLRRDIADSIRTLDEDDIAKLEPIVGNYVEFKEQDREYELLGDREQEQYIEDNNDYLVNRLFWSDSGLVTIPDLKTAFALENQAHRYNVPLDMIPAFQLNDSGNERIPSNRNLWDDYFSYYDLPGTSYLNMTQSQVDDGRLPDKYRQEWNTYQRLTTDFAKDRYRNAHREAAYTKWREDFRRTNAEFDQWLVDQEYNKPLPKKAITRPRTPSRPAPTGPFGGAGGVSRPRQPTPTFPTFPKPKTGISIGAPRVPGF